MPTPDPTRWLLPAVDAPRRDAYRVTTRTGTTDARGRPPRVGYTVRRLFVGWLDFDGGGVIWCIGTNKEHVESIMEKALRERGGWCDDRAIYEEGDALYPKGLVEHARQMLGVWEGYVLVVEGSEQGR